MKYFAVSALLVAAAAAVDDFFMNSIDGHPVLTIGSEITLHWKLPNPPTSTFKLTLRAENQTAYGHVPGPFGGTIGLYDLRDQILEEALPLAAGTYKWKVAPSGGDETFIGEEVYYFLRADWFVEGQQSYHNGAGTNYFTL